MKRSVVRGFLALLLGITVGCQSTSSVPPTARQSAVEPLPNVVSMTPAELSGDYVSFPLTDHELAMRLPDGFCVTSARTPLHLQEALARFDVSTLEMKVLALSCAALEGQTQLAFPIPMVVAGLMRREGVPLVFDADLGEDYARMVRILGQQGDSKIRDLARELFLKSMVSRIERSGFAVGHLDMRSRNNRIRLEVLAEVPVDGIDGNVWYFADFLVGPVGDRLLGVGVVNVDLVPSPPAVSQNSEMLFATLRQVRK
ncbi:MAG: hypothetical protein P1U37_11690 [Minwuia sp.]|nr:hypothetical protein [Minwuia sp.]